MTSSWRLKLARAEEHLRNLADEIGIPIGRNPCPVHESLNADGEYEYAIEVPGAVSQRVPIMVGELLFNIRSALDHLTCALIPTKDKGRAQFPIFDVNPLEVDESTGKYAHPWARGAWNLQTKGVPCPARAVMAMLQPFYQAREARKPAEHNSLSILRRLQDADKHRELLYASPTLFETTLHVNNEQLVGIVPGLKDGAKVFAFPHQVDVQVEGVVRVPIGIGDNFGYAYPLVFDTILDNIANNVLPGLEPFLPASEVDHRTSPRREVRPTAPERLAGGGLLYRAIPPESEPEGA